ncbi:DUF3489 domain-containing protein [Roseomonas sp. BN140053]|uniref:DUF3489 domain-containing protein n=1 Tax=Roseomonas sp. BN140053 TaxID=3391898 RepID=UPI0039E874FF
MVNQSHAATLPDVPAPPRQAVIASLLKTGLLVRKSAPNKNATPELAAARHGLSLANAVEGLQAAEPPAQAPVGLLGAVQAVVAAWDAESPPTTLSAAVEQLRTALMRKLAQRTTTSSRGPRTGTKQAAVLALLRRPEGATIAQVIEATDWAPHTVRGFLAGLKRRGTPVEVLDRVRQVGPGRAGAKGSYTVYRVAEAG